MAFMLLASCKLSDSEQQLVMSAINVITYDKMREALSRIFHGEINMQLAMPVPKPAASRYEVKSDPVFLEDVGGEAGPSEKLNESLFVRGTQRGRSRGVWCEYSPIERAPSHGRGERRRQNPVEPDGRISTCIICDSHFHWATECPDAYENQGNSGRYKEDTEHTVNFSLFAVEVKNKSKRIFSKLVEEAKDCAVLDSGCDKSVCGERWLNTFVEELSDHDREGIVERESYATFHFANGATVLSKKRVTLPCWIGGIKGNIKTDVVECNTPLMLSRSSMKKAKMVIDFDSDKVTVYGREVSLRTSSRGLYLLPILAQQDRDFCRETVALAMLQESDAQKRALNLH